MGEWAAQRGCGWGVKAGVEAPKQHLDADARVRLHNCQLPPHGLRRHRENAAGEHAPHAQHARLARP